jgi:maltose-binding protein MalE
LKKLMLLAALLALLALAVVPALAQVSQESEQDADSGDVDQNFTATGGGDNSSQCANIQGAANTGNSQNQIDLIQYASTADDFEFDETGSTITVSPNADVNGDIFTCTTAVNQAASASG